MAALNVVVVGGHGKVATRLTRLLTSRPDTTVTSIIRKEEHRSEVQAIGATALVMSLEDDAVEAFRDAFKHAKADVVYFTAGSGGIGGLERLRSVDEQGAIKVFDAIEGLGEDVKKPRLILLSSLDVRDQNKPHPAHYTAEDIELSAGFRKAIGPYLDAKYNADKNLVTRSSFKWTILRPNWYTDEQGSGTGHIGRAHLKDHISRDDVAKVLYLLLEKEAADGLSIDLAGGKEPFEQGLDEFIKRGETDFIA